MLEYNRVGLSSNLAWQLLRTAGGTVLYMSHFASQQGSPLERNLGLSSTVMIRTCTCPVLCAHDLPDVTGTYLFKVAAYRQLPQ
jgi:hypothetical protein